MEKTDWPCHDRTLGCSCSYCSKFEVDNVHPSEVTQFPSPKELLKAQEARLKPELTKWRKQIIEILTQSFAGKTLKIDIKGMHEQVRNKITTEAQDRGWKVEYQTYDDMRDGSYHYLIFSMSQQYSPTPQDNLR